MVWMTANLWLVSIVPIPMIRSTLVLAMTSAIIRINDHLLQMIKAAQVVNPQMILILTMMMLGLYLPEVKMQRVCWIYDKEFYLQQRIGAEKPPNLHSNTNPQVNLILTMIMLGLNLPEVKIERVCWINNKELYLLCRIWAAKKPRVPPQYKYHSVFQTIPCHLLTKDLYILKAIIEESTDSSFYRRSKTTPQSILNSKVESWNMRKVTNTVSFSIFDDNIGEDSLSAQSMYGNNIDDSKIPKCLVS